MIILSQSRIIKTGQTPQIMLKAVKKAQTGLTAGLLSCTRGIKEFSSAVGYSECGCQDAP
jgi:hypothetical protein